MSIRIGENASNFFIGHSEVINVERDCYDNSHTSVTNNHGSYNSSHASYVDSYNGNRTNHHDHSSYFPGGYGQGPPPFQQFNPSPPRRRPKHRAYEYDEGDDHMPPPRVQGVRTPPAGRRPPYSPGQAPPWQAPPPHHPPSNPFSSYRPGPTYYNGLHYPPLDGRDSGSPQNLNVYQDGYAWQAQYGGPSVPSPQAPPPKRKAKRPAPASNNIHVQQNVSYFQGPEEQVYSRDEARRPPPQSPNARPPSPMSSDSTPPSDPPSEDEESSAIRARLQARMKSKRMSTSASPAVPKTVEGIANTKLGAESNAAEHSTQGAAEGLPTNSRVDTSKKNNISGGKSGEISSSSAAATTAPSLSYGGISIHPLMQPPSASPSARPSTSDTKSHPTPVVLRPPEGPSSKSASKRPETYVDSENFLRPGPSHTTTFAPSSPLSSIHSGEYLSHSVSSLTLSSQDHGPDGESHMTKVTINSGGKGRKILGIFGKGKKPEREIFIE